MKTRCTLALTGLLLLACVLPVWADGPIVSYGKAIQYDSSPPLLDMIEHAPPAAPSENRQVPIGIRPHFAPDPAGAAPDGGLQSFSAPALAATPAPIVSAPGLSEQDNVDTVGFAVVPPDTNGDIGFDDGGNRVYVQYINSVWGVFDDTGNLIAGPFAGNSFWTGFGGPCQFNNDGDPVVLYDDHANQWFFSQFSIGEGVQCVAVSQTSNPLGPYYRYAFLVTPGGNNDYPKLGVWDDGTSGSSGQSAYTFTLRDFGGAGGAFSVSAGVMERDAILNGLPAAFVKFINPCVADDCIEGQLPPHMDGPQAPAGTCPTFWTAVDEAYDDSPWGSDGYRNHTLCVDWDNLAASTYSEGPLVVAGSNFDRFLGNGFSDCISPVNGGEDLDCLAAFTMFRAQYRWFGDNARVVFNTTVDADGTDRAGIRWVETRSADGDSGWFLEQDGTYAPDDGLERWMGSIAQDKAGNIALGYSVTGEELFPSVRYTSRTAGDAPGTMAGGEVSCHEGTGAQVGSSNRWGDYSSMSVDPSDDCTFWYTQEYYETTTSFDFSTRICSFTFPDCADCARTEDPETSCDDFEDNDCDGDFDCADSDCSADPACNCVPEICDDGVDNDCDLLVDCGDPDCDSDPVCLAPPVPENDLCEDAILIECGQTILGTTNNATFDDVGFCSTSNTAPGVWYKTAAAGYLIASTCNQADYDTKLSVFEGECGDLGCIGGNDDAFGCGGFTSEVSWTSDGSENLILVHGFGSSTGSFDLTLTCVTPAENDVCEDAIGPLAVGSVTSGSTDDATPDEPPSIDCGTSVTAPGLWYTVVGTGNTMTASTCNDGDPSTGGANYDTKISVYCADCETKECIGGQDDNFGAGCAGFTTKFDWPTIEGNTYNVFVHGFANQTGDFDLAILDDGVPYEGPPLNDCDGVYDGLDYCPGTVQPEAAPTSGSLKPNMSALTGSAGYGVFETAGPNPQGVMYTTADTMGCSCEQIVDLLGKGQGHLKFGCSFSVMDEWLAFADGFCQDCLIANGTPGCQNGECEAAVCAIDPFCCDVFWDGICASEAAAICEGDICEAVTENYCGDCLISNGTPGCSNDSCEEAVCAIDPFCCDVSWDGICAGIAEDICVPAICEGPFSTIEGGRAYQPEPVSKDPNYTPKE